MKANVNATAMALVSYVLLSTLIAGLRGSFDPALLSSILSWAVFVVGFEILILYLFKVLSNLLVPFTMLSFHA